MTEIKKRFVDQGKIADAMRSLRKRADILQKDVAEAIGIPRARYNRAEVGEVRLTIDQIHRLIEFYRRKKIYADYNYVFEGILPDANLREKLKNMQQQVTQLKSQLKDKDEIIRMLKESQKATV